MLTGSENSAIINLILKYGRKPMGVLYMSDRCGNCSKYDGKYCDEDGKLHDSNDSCRDYDPE